MDTYCVWTMYAYNTDGNEHTDKINISVIAATEPDAIEAASKIAHRQFYRAIQAIEQINQQAIIAKSVDGMSDVMKGCSEKCQG